MLALNTRRLLLRSQLVLPAAGAQLIAQVVEDTPLLAGEVQVKVGLVVVALEVHLQLDRGGPCADERAGTGRMFSTAMV